MVLGVLQDLTALGFQKVCRIDLSSVWCQYKVLGQEVFTLFKSSIHSGNFSIF
jgi:hypothetical protein